MKRKLAIAGVIFSAFMLFCVFMLMNQDPVDEKMISTNFCLYTCLLGYCIYRIYKGEEYFEKQKEMSKRIKNKERQKKQQAKDKIELEKINQKLNSGKAIADFKAQIIYGLPVPEGAMFDLRMNSDGIQCKVNEETTFFIPMDRVIGANSVVKKDVVQIVKSNYGKAAFGGLLFGDAGAIIGGMPETQFADKYTSLYIFAYKNKAGVDSTLLFMADDEWEADRFIRHMKLLKPVAEEDKLIEL